MHLRECKLAHVLIDMRFMNFRAPWGSGELTRCESGQGYKLISTF